MAVTAIGLASTLMLLMPASPVRSSSFLLLGTVVLIAWYCGRWPGFVATLLASTAQVVFLLRADPGDLGSKAAIELGLFVLVALGMNLLVAERGRAAGRLRLSRDDLQRRVDVRTRELDQAHKDLEAGAQVRQRAEETLSQFAAIEASTEDAVFALRLDGTIVSCNPGAERLYGCATAELVGQSVAVCFPRGSLSDLSHLLARVARGETIAPFESMRERIDLNPVQLLVTIFPIKDAAGTVRGICALVRDITRRKQAERKIEIYQQQLRDLASALSFAEQRERRRIAAELHDHLAQMLVMARVKVRMLQRTSIDTSDLMEEVRLLLDESIDYTRTLIWNLCPPVLYEVGLEAALEWLAEQFQERHGIRVRFEDDDQPKTSHEDIRVLLFHAVHELLLNVVHHAQATQAVVAITSHGEYVEVHVEDNGVGFDPDGARVQVGQNRGFGLFSIRERLGVVGGSLEIRSKHGAGACVTLRAPSHQAAECTTRQQPQPSTAI